DSRIVELALVNDKVTGRKAPPQHWLFQSELTLTASDGGAVFLPTRDPLTDTHDEPDPELRRLDLLYRDRLEYAVGRTCSVTWDEDVSVRRARSIHTTWLPMSDIPQTRAVGAQGVLLDMKALSEADGSKLAVGLQPLPYGY